MQQEPARRTAAHNPLGNRVGGFRYWFDSDVWEWSPEVAAMHGYGPGECEPTTELLRGHKHPDDRATFDALVDTMRRTRTQFSSRHRIVDTRGRVHSVAVIGRTFTEDGAVAGSEGYYVDLGVLVGDEVRDEVNTHVQSFRRQRSSIEQAKGMLMLMYGIDEDRAFDVLRWRSQQENRKLNDMCRALVDLAPARLRIPEQLRREFDLIVLSPFDGGCSRTSS
ncbi:PAS and ANTAR domain-containing protein [Gordonia sp. PP30]|uniref:PAS and ANTAR domain-containing protein n=1 Tax=unclassified Gordonia (in: high G+C Gram-positive bacteria) TaxID=2657482 RepID=UPI001FFF3786|nr:MULTISPECIES: PAS and ANTAR domain-containing protein [unclassified Gordonia (in: high G+C Gram-positive bacteria)]UQE76310.1 PAS and ANTAR domain-containing protein [Gordonia sp. PP30]